MKTMKTIRLLGAVSILAVFVGCASLCTEHSARPLTRDQALKLAQGYARSHGRDLSKYRLVLAEPHREWWFYYDGIEQTPGNQISIVVNEETGKVGLLPGE